MSCKFDIYVDSGANLGDREIKERDIKVIPYYYNVGGEERVCYDPSRPFEETAKEFYAFMRSGAEIKTSLISTARFIEAVTPSLENGKDVLIITISSGISGTYAQAKEAEKQLKKAYPKRHICVADSCNASLGTGLLVLRAADLRDMGESCEACADWIRENAYFMNSYLTVGDLKYLRKGGRISATAAIAGAILNIKPVIHADGGSPARLEVIGKERGRKKALGAILKAFDERAAGTNQTVAIAHCDCGEEALELAEEIKKRGVKDVLIQYYDLCTGAHAGPGTIALFFFGKDRRSKTVAEPKARGKTVKQSI